MNKPTLFRAAAALLLTACLVPAAADEAIGGAPESLEEVAVKTILPPRFLRSAHYDIAEYARASDNFYRFRVSTDDADYDVTSLAMLRIRLHEIATTAEVSTRLGHSNITLDRSPGGRRGVASERVVDILSDPVGTASQLLGNIGYNLEQTFGGQDADESAKAANAARDLNPGPHKRSAAAQLGVDVYTSNAALQEILNAVAQARSAGKTAASFSPLVRNVYAAPPFGSGALNAELDSRLKNTPAEDILAGVDEQLAALGVDAATRVALLTHPAWSPRTRLYFTAYLAILAPLERLPALVAAAATARTEADAVAYVVYARMLAYYRLNHGALAEVVTTTRFPTLASADGNAVLALPVDFLAWTPAVVAAADTLGEIRAAHGLAGFTVLLAGQPTARAAAELAERDVVLRPAYSF